MKIRYLIALSLLLATGAQAASGDMDVYVWDPGCNHTTATNWFTLAPGERSQKIYVDLKDCNPEQIGSLVFFGNYGTKTSGRQLQPRHRIKLSMSALDGYGNVVEQLTSDSGSILADVANMGSTGCWLIAQNMNRNKEVMIRLRAQLLVP